MYTRLQLIWLSPVSRLGFYGLYKSRVVDKFTVCLYGLLAYAKIFLIKKGRFIAC